MVNGLSDVFSQLSGHFQSVDEVRGRSQDGVVGHEVRGSDRRVVGIQVDCCAVGCVATAAVLQGGERGKNDKMNRRTAYGETTVEKHKKQQGMRPMCSVFLRHFFRTIKLPFSTLGVGIIGEKHRQKAHEVFSLWPLLPTGCHGPTVHAGGIYH